MKYVILSVFLCFSVISSAQISRGGHPYPFSPKKSVLIPYRLPSIDHERAIRENFENQEKVRGKKPFRFAENLNVEFSPENAGTWTVESDGTRIWRLALTSGGAYGLSVFFDRFRLEEGSMVFLYDPSQNTILGGFNRQNNKASGNLQTGFIPGAELVIELQVSKDQEIG